MIKLNLIKETVETVVYQQRTLEFSKSQILHSLACKISDSIVY